MSAATSGALSGAASGASAGMAFGPWGAAIGGVVGGIGGYFSGKSADKDAKNNQQKLVDIPAIAAQARDQARQNVIDSNALEREFDPQTAALRLRTNDFMRDSIAGNDAGQRRRDALLAQMNAAAGTSLGSAGRNGVVDQLGDANAIKDPGQRDSLLNGLIAAAADKDPSAQSLSREGSAQVLADLRRGGQLDPETQAEIARSSLEGSGNSGILGSLAGRGLTARDLGLSSMQLRQQRQDRANTLGMALGDRALAADQANLGFAAQAYGQDLDAGFQQRAQQMQAFGLNQDARAVSRNQDLAAFQADLNSRAADFDRLGNTANAYDAASRNDFGRRFDITQLINNRARPVSGLSPGDVAGLAVGNVRDSNTLANNASAQSAYNRNQALNAGASLIGTIGSLYTGSRRPPSEYGPGGGT